MQARDNHPRCARHAGNPLFYPSFDPTFRGMLAGSCDGPALAAVDDGMQQRPLPGARMQMQIRPVKM
jgi:hypothetical protein